MSSDRVGQMVAYAEGGVCQNLDELCKEVLGLSLTDLTAEELKDLDSQVFTCEGCGWTMPSDDQSDDDSALCNSCHEEDSEC